MIVKLEVVNVEVIHYMDKTGKPAEFSVLNARETLPATLLTPFRLSVRDFPQVVPPCVVELAVSEVRCGDKDKSINVRGSVLSMSPIGTVKK